MPPLDESISLHRLTVEILEACISRESHATDVEELQAFLKAADCDLIRLQLFGVAASLQTGQAFDTLEDVETFVGAGKLDLKRAVNVVCACIRFFIIGWHARGAVEETETLKRLVGTH